MQLLKERILKDGIVKPGNILKVDSFLNHQMDIKLFGEIGKEFKRRFADVEINKILTIEIEEVHLPSGLIFYCLSLYCPLYLIQNKRFHKKHTCFLHP